MHYSIGCIVLFLILRMISRRFFFLLYLQFGGNESNNNTFFHFASKIYDQWSLVTRILILYITSFILLTTKTSTELY